MIKCRTCGAASYPGTLFCNECGAGLFGDTAAVTDPPQFSDQVHFLLPENGRRGVLDLSDPVWIGRADPDQGYWPAIDLTDDNGLELGVSRRHAMLQKSDEGIVIIDQDSANGTWLDQQQLLPNRPYAISNPAIMRFGRLVVHFFIG